ncbi:MAG: nucleotidyltransferase domain-containing protein [Candidatus Korarchaeota archaeon]|nr:nucleotidyltransferase domain-containing protein [Candidatus Korarchaeota archaeon]
MPKKSLMDLQREIVEEEREYFQRPMEYASRIAEIARDLLGDPNVRVFLFGSAAEGRAIPGASDIDILVISDRAPTKPGKLAELRVEILSRLGDLAAPVEIHILPPDRLDWLRRAGRVIPVR